MNAHARPEADAQPVQTPEIVAGLPPQYSMGTVGDCMEPFIRSGQKLVFDSAAEIRPHDFVAIWWSSGRNAPGSFQVQIKQIVLPEHDGDGFV